MTPATAPNEPPAESQASSPILEHWWRGIVFSLIVGFFVAFMGHFVKRATARYTSGDILFFRVLWTSVLLLPFIARDLGLFLNKGSLFLWTRGTFGAVGALCYFVTLKEAPVAIAVLLYSLSPVFVFFIAGFFFGERLSKIQILGATITLGGVIALRVTNVESIPPWLIAIGVLGALMSGLAFVSLRQISLKYKPTLIVFSLSFASIFVSLPFASDWSSTALQWQDSDLLAVLATSMIAQYFLTLTYRNLPASIASIMTQSSVLWGTWFDRIWWGIDITAILICNYILIIFGLILVQHPWKKFALRRHSIFTIK